MLELDVKRLEKKVEMLQGELDELRRKKVDGLSNSVNPQDRKSKLQKIEMEK